MSLQYILKALDILNNAEVQGKWSTQPRIVLEMAAIKLVNIEEELTLEERVKRLEQGIKPVSELDSLKPVIMEKKTEIKPKMVEKQLQETEEVKTPREEYSYEDTSLTFDNISTEWPKVMQSIKTKKINIYALIMEGQLISYENNLLTIAYNEGFGFHKEAVSSKQNKEFVEDIVSKYFSKKITIHFYMKDELKMTKENPEMQKEDAIKQVIDIFGKDIVEIE